MKATAENRKMNKERIKPFDNKVWCDMTFDDNELADKFVKSLNLAGISCKKNGSIVTISYID